MAPRWVDFFIPQGTAPLTLQELLCYSLNFSRVLPFIYIVTGRLVLGATLASCVHADVYAYVFACVYVCICVCV